MNIVVCIKQVPDTQDIKWSENNTIVREGLISIINPQDEFALFEALKLKEKNKDIKITTISMGPNQAKEALKYTIAQGADEAILLSDKLFTGSDTLATGKTISSAIKKFIPNFDIILCGQYALDGDTAQTGLTISNMLNIEAITYADEIELENNFLIVKKETDEGYQTLKIKTPCLICMAKENIPEKNPKIDDYIKAENKEIKIINSTDIEIDPNDCGIKGSPTWVNHVYRKQTKRNCEELTEFSAKNLLNKIGEVYDR